MSRKKILWLCSWYPNKAEPFNGDFIQRHARAAALFNDIYVIHVSADGSGRVSQKETTIHSDDHLTEQVICFRKSFSYPGRLIAHYRLLRLFRHAIRKYLKENGKPDLVHVHVPIWAGILGLWLKRRMGVEYVLTEHWGIYNDVEVNNYNNKSSKFKRCTKVIFRHAARFISVSRYLAEGVNRLVIQKDFTIIPNVTNTDLFNYREFSSPVFRFIHVSNMVPLKNTEGILRAFALFYQQNNNTELVMVGDTDPSIRDFASALGLPGKAVSFRGEVPYEEVATEMQRSHCFILFSHIENSPCVIGEALCCGLAVIATRVGGVPELVDESNAILIEPGNEEALVNAMTQVIVNYPNYDRSKIAREARARFNYDTVGRKLDKIYEEVLTDNRRPVSNIQ